MIIVSFIHLYSKCLAHFRLFNYQSSYNFITLVSACVYTGCALARRGQEGLRAEEAETLPARWSKTIAGKQKNYFECGCKEIYYIHVSKQTRVVHTMCTSLARPRMGYAPKKSAEKKQYSIDINDIFSLNKRGTFFLSQFSGVFNDLL